ncbi:siderophore ABC transporter substrate-binding protein [Aquamicrobium segne]|uniref:Siderophore ABC transporter substrate-binding protein n=1 Tax=Aquamicrobium segne TaxID=469547 RepID=A0ABW0H3K5_9HYPH
MNVKTFLSALALTLSAVTLGYAAPVKHAQGETNIDGVPQKIVVFDLAVVDTLDVLGVEIDGLPTGILPSYLQKYADSDIANIGTMFEPDYEAVAALEPDLIIVGGRSAPKYAELSRLAPTIDLTVDRTNFFASAKQNAVTLGEIFGKQAEAAKAVTALDASLAGLAASAENAGNVLVMITTGGRMSAHGPGSRFDVVFSDYGFKPAVDGLDTGTHGQAISNEFILETNPDWLFVVDRDAAIGREGVAASQMLDNELVNQTTAWQKNQVVYLDPVSWYLVGGGLTAMSISIDQIAEALAKN